MKQKSYSLTSQTTHDEGVCGENAFRWDHQTPRLVVAIYSSPNS